MALVTNQLERVVCGLCEGIHTGSLEITNPEGKSWQFGDGIPTAQIKINDWAAVTALMARGDIGLGEAYVAGLWESPSIENLIQVALLNRDVFDSVAHGNWVNRLKFLFVDRLLRRNSHSGSSRNIQSHYDVGNDFYGLWLDDSMTYSSGIFDDAAGSDHDVDKLSGAQQRKYDRLLSISEGERTLEIGCGWGGFIERALEHDRTVSAVTISPSQKAFADARTANRADIRLQDYRDIKGQFDSIVSIEMIEAVGERYWPVYFQILKDRLVKGGRAALQSIVVDDELFPDYRTRSDYIRHYTFPGGMLLSPGKIAEQANRAGLHVQPVFSFGQDYARTLRIWRGRFEGALPEIRRLGYGEEFIKSWRFYLELCAASFAVGHTNVVQVELINE